MGVSQSFSVSRSGQDNRSLWIFAEDAGHPNYFKMFNLNSNSIQTTLDINAPTFVSLNLPANEYNFSTETITFNCSATNFDGLSNITLYGNWSGWHANKTNDVSGTSNSTTFTRNLSTGSYKWNCLVYDINGNYGWGDTNYTLIIDSTAPIITIVSPTNTSYNTNSIGLNVSADEIGRAHV